MADGDKEQIEDINDCEPLIKVIEKARSMFQCRKWQELQKQCWPGMECKSIGAVPN